MLSTSKLHAYQHHATRFAVETKRSALFMGLGLGKTVTTLSAIAMEIFTGDAERVLIIAPLRVANTVWHAEAENWEHTCALTFAIATGSAAERRRALDSDADVTVINVENVPWLVQNYPRSRWVWDWVVIDESQGFKSPSSLRFKRLRQAAVDKLTRRDKKTVVTRSPVKRMTLLSATPATNGIDGLWSQLALIDGGERLHRSFSAFQAQWFTKNPYAHQFAKPDPKPDAATQIFDKVADVVHVLRTEDYLEMPPLISNSIEVCMPEAAMEQYRKLERDFLLNIGDDEIFAQSEGALAGKLLQLSNGAVYKNQEEHEQGPKEYVHFHDAKIDALKEIVEAASGAENLLIAYYYQSDLKRLQEAFPHAATMDKKGEMVPRWNAGKIPLLLAQPMSAGLGLNLQQGGSSIVFFSLLWQLEAYQQFIGRLYRQGQTNTVTVNHLICEGTIEHRVLAGLRSKAETQQEFLDYLRSYVTFSQAA